MKNPIVFIIALFIISLTLLSYKVYALSEKNIQLENNVAISTLTPIATTTPTQLPAKKPSNNVQPKPTSQPSKEQTVNCVLPYGTFSLAVSECNSLRAKYYGDYDLSIKTNTSTPVPVATLKSVVYCSVEKKTKPAYCEGGYDLNNPSLVQTCGADPYYYACANGLTPSIQNLSQGSTCTCN